MSDDVNLSEDNSYPFDETLLEKARTQWQFGDWQSLIKLNIESLQHHPQREKLALLAAAGHFQVGDKNEAYRFIRIAQDWGCSKKSIVQILVSGTHHTLGCASFRLDRHALAYEHLRNAIKLGGVPGDADLLLEARAVRQDFTDTK